MDNQQFRLALQMAARYLENQVIELMNDGTLALERDRQLISEAFKLNVNVKLLEQEAASAHDNPQRDQGAGDQAADQQ